MKPIFKHKYIKEYSFSKNKTMKLKYFKLKKYKPSYLINPNHIFNHNGFQTVIVQEGGIETINPLDFKSKYKESDFTSAIESKIIKETFVGLKQEKLDIMKVLLFINLGITILLLYLLLKSTGAI